MPLSSRHLQTLWCARTVWTAGETTAPPSLAKRQVAQFIKHQQIQLRQALGHAAGLVHQLFVLQRIDQVHRGVEPHLLAVPRHTRHTQRRGQMRLARTPRRAQSQRFCFAQIAWPSAHRLAWADSL